MISTQSLHQALERHPVVLLEGPKGAGKHTLAREAVPADSLNHIDLEDPQEQGLMSQPMTRLASLKGNVVIHEIPRCKELFPVLRVLADRKGTPAKFLLTSSARGNLLRQNSESLAGRIERISMEGLPDSHLPLAPERLESLWFRGSLPGSLHAKSNQGSMDWWKTHLQDLLERHLPQWGEAKLARDPDFLSGLVQIARCHGQTLPDLRRDHSYDPAAGPGIPAEKLDRILQVLEDCFWVRRLPPHEEVRPPHGNGPSSRQTGQEILETQIWIRDTGLLHFLQGARTPERVKEFPFGARSFPAGSASWRGFAMNLVLDILRPDEAEHWDVYPSGELDLVLRWESHKIGVLCSPQKNPHEGYRIPSFPALDRIRELEALVVVHPGTREGCFGWGGRICSIPLRNVTRLPEHLQGIL